MALVAGWTLTAGQLLLAAALLAAAGLLGRAAVGGKARGAAWAAGVLWAALAVFVAFLGWNLWAALRGADSCGCFGAVAVHPGVTAAIDAAAIAGLALGLAVLRRAQTETQTKTGAETKTQTGAETATRAETRTGADTAVGVGAGRVFMRRGAVAGGVLVMLAVGAGARTAYESSPGVRTMAAAAGVGTGGAVGYDCPFAFI